MFEVVSSSSFKAFCIGIYSYVTYYIVSYEDLTEVSSIVFAILMVRSRKTGKWESSDHRVRDHTWTPIRAKQMYLLGAQISHFMVYLGCRLLINAGDCDVKRYT